MSANVREKLIALSTAAQPTISQAANSFFRISEVGADLVDLQPVVEDDADEYGKGHEFAEQAFLTSWDTKRKLDLYLSAEALAWAAAYGLGSGTSNTFTPIDPVTNPFELELPYATFIETIRQGSNPIRDIAFLAMCIENFKIDVKSGPGRANSKIEINLAGTGQIVEPSGISMPQRSSVNLLPSASLTCTINGTDYVSNKNFVSWEFSWDNNIRMNSGFFPGSGFQTAGNPTTGAIRGRMEFGDRKVMSKFVARYDSTSSEFATLIAQTSGTAVFGLTGGNSTAAQIDLHQITYKTTKLDNTDGIVTVEVDMSCQMHPSNGLLTFTVTHGLGNIGR